MIKTLKKGLIIPYKTLMLIGLFIAGISSNTEAQSLEYSRPSWWFGLAGGANLNFYDGSTQKINDDLEPPVTFNKGFGISPFAAIVIEYYKPKTYFGFMFHAGYDGRSGAFDEEISPCNCPANLSTNLSYITIEPSLRFAPFKSGFYLFAGPRFAFNMSKSFTYSLGTNPAFPEQTPDPDIKGDFSNVNSTVVSMQIGAGYDIQLSSKMNHTQWVLSPFVSFHPYFGQAPRSVETWNLSTLRIGAAIKLGRGHRPAAEAKVVPVIAPVAVIAASAFSVNSPKNIPVERRVRETFPLRNYVYFDLGSTKIPNRYVLIKKEEVSEFKLERLETTTPKTLSGRSDREMIVYYNILNILGDRMTENPSASINLVGSSELGPVDGKEMAESIKSYLTSVWSINPTRITTIGNSKPKIPSEQPGGKLELILLREGDRRVSIESASPALLMEFQSGPDAPLKPVVILAVQEAPLDSYISFNADGADEKFTTWNLEITDETGTKQYFGPYTQQKVSIPGKAIMGTTPEGTYDIQMIGNRADGSKVIHDTTVHMVLWTPPVDEEGMRFSILYEFNQSKAISMYEKYLTEVVVPKIPKGATVIIHGHTDVIGEDVHNRELSAARSADVKNIMAKALAKAGRKDVKFEVFGFGEDTYRAPFENASPEERSYNRTVIIDIIPVK